MGIAIKSNKIEMLLANLNRVNSSEYRPYFARARDTGLLACLLVTFGLQTPAAAETAIQTPTGEATNQETTRPAPLTLVDGDASVQSPLEEPALETVDFETPASDSPFDFLKSQIAAGEAEQALNSLDSEVRTLEDQHHRYHADLLTPVQLRGDAYFELQQYDEALNEYGRARHIARVSYGLFDPRQIESVYSEAKVLKQLGDVENSGKREEYAYEVARRSYDDYDQALLPPTIRLAEFYMEHRNPLAARTLLNRAQLIHERHDSFESEQAVSVLRAIAKSHRLERFPPVYVDTSDEDRSEEVFGARLRNTDLDNQTQYINSFPAGERALQQIITIQTERYGETAQATIDAMLELADWHLMFGRSQAAHTLYEHIYAVLEGVEEEATGKGAIAFAEPQLLHFPKPDNPKPPSLAKRGDSREGYVAVVFGVSPTGSVRKLKTVTVDGPKKMNYRVRRSMREAIFRPRLEQGVVTGTVDHTFRYHFPYFEELTPEEAEPQPGADAEEVSHAG